MEIVNTCLRAYDVLKRVTEAKAVDSSSGPTRKQIQDLGRCVNSAPPSTFFTDYNE